MVTGVLCLPAAMRLAERLATLVNHGMKVRYYHDMIGVNSRLDTLQAAILRVKLRYLDDYIKARQKAADYYDNAFKNTDGIHYSRKKREQHACLSSVYDKAARYKP